MKGQRISYIWVNNFDQNPKRQLYSRDKNYFYLP